MGRTSLSDRAADVQQEATHTLRAFVREMPDRMADFASTARSATKDLSEEAAAAQHDAMKGHDSPLGKIAFAGMATVAAMLPGLLKRRRVQRTGLMVVRSHPVLLGGVAAALGVGGFLLSRRLMRMQHEHAAAKSDSDAGTAADSADRDASSRSVQAGTREQALGMDDVIGLPH